MTASQRSAGQPASAESSRPRVVMFVYNDVRNDTRVLREAATLYENGFDVTIMGRPVDVLSRQGDREDRDGVVIVRVPIPGGWRTARTFLFTPWRLYRYVLLNMWGGLRQLPGGIRQTASALMVGLLAIPWTLVRLPLFLIWRALGHPPKPHGSTLEWLIRWRWGTIGWARDAAAAAPVADVYHGHDLSGLAGAVSAQQRHGGLVVYDSHEYFLESGSNASRPGWSKRLVGRQQKRWSAHAAALVTVNRTLGDMLSRELGISRVVVVHNAPPRWTPPAEPSDPLREAAGIAPNAPIALYHGGFSPDRGLLEVLDAWRLLGHPTAHLVFLGYGLLRDELIRRASDPGLDGRVHVLPAVAPEVLATWVACADVGLMPNQPRTANERLSTPNKLFESLAVGLPVVSSDFPERRAIVIDDPDGPLGAVCDPTDMLQLATAIGSILDLSPDARADLRRRCLKAAHERWNWETESARLTELYRSLARPSELA